MGFKKIRCEGIGRIQLAKSGNFLTSLMTVIFSGRSLVHRVRLVEKVKRANHIYLCIFSTSFVQDFFICKMWGGRTWSSVKYHFIYIHDGWNSQTHVTINSKSCFMFTGSLSWPFHLLWVHFAILQEDAE
jgi:hypothetical protein